VVRKKLDARTKEFMSRKKLYYMSTSLLYSFFFFVLLAGCKQSIRLGKPEMPTASKQAFLDEAWYPRSPEKLTTTMTNLKHEAALLFPVQAQPEKIRAIIVPHASLTYSGLCAAAAYNALQGQSYKRIIILAPSHHQFFHSIALPDYGTYHTPLGPITVDYDAIYNLTNKNYFSPYMPAHDYEHGIEMQLPFLQTTVKNFSIIPLVVGNMTEESLTWAATWLKKFIDDETLIVVSADFVHHGSAYKYEMFTKNIIPSIQTLDSLALQTIGVHDLPTFWQLLQQTKATICGQEPIKVLMALTRTGVLPPCTAQLAAYYTSAHIQAAAQTTMPRTIQSFLTPPIDSIIQNSVSYASLIFREVGTSTVPTLSGFEAASLLAYTRRILAQKFKSEADRLSEKLIEPVLSPQFSKPYGAFVTLYRHNNTLRGCIGHIQTDQPLYYTLKEITPLAAFEDKRFLPLSADELADVKISITLLEKPSPIKTLTEFVLGKHGIILKRLDAKKAVIASAVFLPEVALQQGWNKDQLLAHLSIKAGLPADGWKTACRFEIFQAVTYKEQS
jgi:MEMO1 family protein